MTTYAAEESVHEALQLIAVVVSFPVSPKGPVGPTAKLTSVGTVLQAAMDHFAVADGAQYSYALSHDGIRQANNTTIGQIAREAHAVEFRLIKEITQG